MTAYQTTMSSLRHPDYQWDYLQWEIYRDTFRGGQDYLDRYLYRWSDRETQNDFFVRKSITPIPTFAKAAVLDIRNSIYQRLSDISRSDGSDTYKLAVNGEAGGVDRKGSSMNSFIGIEVLTELLIMGRVGVFVDAPAVVPSTLSTSVAAPYLYVYPIEDILSWTYEKPENPGQFKAVLLRDWSICMNNDLGVELPSGRETRYRLVWKDDITGKVHYKLMDEKQETIYLPNSREDGSVMLEIEEVPFIMPTIGDSLLKDVASYQKALLNLISSDVNWTIKSNIPFLTIQTDGRAAASHLKPPGADGTPGSQPANGATEAIGGKGRYYGLNEERPDFIAPPTDPLRASMALQEKLEDNIRSLINLAVANKVGSRTESAEAKKISSQGLEAGLSFIGLVLQQAEQQIANLWANYENYVNPKPATIAYPSRYTLKSDEERIKEAKDLLELSDRLPSVSARKKLACRALRALLGGHETTGVIESSIAEVMDARYTNSNPDQVLAAKAAGLVGDETASMALGYGKGEVEKAKDDHADRVARTLVAQTGPNQMGNNPASRGAPDLDPNPDSGKEEQAAGREEAQNE